MAMILWNGIQFPAIRLDLLDLVQDRVVTVRATAHVQRAESVGERDFGLVTVVAAAGDDLVPGHALPSSRRWRKAQIEIALLCSELAKRADRDVVAGLLGHFYCMDVQ